MNSLTMRYLIVIFLFLSLPGHAQFGKLLKSATKKVKEKVNKEEALDFASKKMASTREKFDTANFTYSIALNDQAGQFDNKKKRDEVATLGSMYLNRNQEKKPLDKAREQIDVGEMAYASNGYRLAEVSLLSALLTLTDENQQSHPMYSRALADLGMLYNSMGRYALSEKFTREALDKRESYRGRKSVDYIASLNNLGVLNKNMGNYNDAEKELSEAVAMNKSLTGPASMPYAIALNNRGVLRQVLGRYDVAEKDMLLALEVAGRNLKERSINFIRLRSNLALLYQQKGQFQKAEEIFKASLDKIGSDPLKSKKTNPDYAHMLENLASLYVEMDRKSEGIALLQQAADIYSRKFGKTYSGYGLVLSKLGTLYRMTDEDERSLQTLEQARSVLEGAYGPGHPNVVEVKIELALSQWKLSNLAESESYFTDALNQSLEFVGTYFAPMSETEKSAYWKTLMPRFEKFYAYVAGSDGDEILLKQCMNYRLATKALLLSSTTKVKNQILNSGNQQLISDYNQWLDQKNLLALYYSFSKEELAEQKVNLDSIQRVANRMEKSLSERSGLFGSTYSSKSPEIGQLQTSLKSGETAIELIKSGHGLDNSSVKYLAIIITRDHLSKVTLDNGDELEGRQFKAYRNFIRIKKDDPYAYEKYWKSINDHLPESSTIYFSPDGVYNQINVNTFIGPTGKYVLDDVNLVNLTTLKDLLNSHDKNLSKEATLLGNPSYGSPSVTPLPGTAKEISIVNKVLKSHQYSTHMAIGSEATESFLKQNSKSSILHVATHGFFVADPKQSNSQVFRIPLNNASENVLLRSGLLLAGEGSSKGAMGFSEENNGVLTSYEVMNLDLSTTDLVVLSACETGLGDVMAGEGVYGLQRAFMVAGASAVIMSLWKVDDLATQQLMDEFYHQLFIVHDKHKAFQLAQEKLKKQFSDPYYWGAFVMVGQ